MEVVFIDMVTTAAAAAAAVAPPSPRNSDVDNLVLGFGFYCCTVLLLPVILCIIRINPI